MLYRYASTTKLEILYW